MLLANLTSGHHSNVIKRPERLNKTSLSLPPPSDCISNRPEEGEGRQKGRCISIYYTTKSRGCSSEGPGRDFVHRFGPQRRAVRTLRLLHGVLSRQFGVMQSTGVAQCPGTIGPSPPFWRFCSVAAVAAPGWCGSLFLTVRISR